MIDATPTEAATTAAPKGRSEWANVWAQFKAHRGAMVGMAVFAAIILLVVFGPIIWDVDPTKTNIRSRNQGDELAVPHGHRPAGP